MYLRCLKILWWLCFFEDQNALIWLNYLSLVMPLHSLNVRYELLDNEVRLKFALVDEKWKRKRKRKGVYKEEGVSKVRLECSIVVICLIENEGSHPTFLSAIIVKWQRGFLAHNNTYKKKKRKIFYLKENQIACR